MVRGQEVLTLVIYDIEDDRIRTRVASACKDYGLERIQYSAFRGPLSATKRSELWARLADELGKEAGRMLVLPVCEKDAEAMREVVNQPAEGKAPDA
jgi:CRISPR-associated protein Cas2